MLSSTGDVPRSEHDDEWRRYTRESQALFTFRTSVQARSEPAGRALRNPGVGGASGSLTTFRCTSWSVWSRRIAGTDGSMVGGAQREPVHRLEAELHSERGGPSWLVVGQNVGRHAGRWSPVKRACVAMSLLLALLGTLRAALKARTDLVLENLALRQQLALLRRRSKRPRVGLLDRVFWMWLSQWWARWREALHVVQPQTVCLPFARAV